MTTLREFLEGDQPIAAVVQGGGMRGIYSIAALAALEAAGYSERFADLLRPVRATVVGLADAL